MSDWYKEVLKNITENNFILAFDKLKEVSAQFGFLEYDIQITLIESQLNQIAKNHRLGLLNDNTEKNKIIFNLLLLVDEIRSTRNEKIGINSNSDLDLILSDQSDDLENLCETLTKDNYSLSEVIGRNLKYLLRRGKFSKKDILKLTNCSSDLLLAYLKGNEIPTLDFLIVLSKLYNLEVTYFFFPKFKGKESITDNDLFKWAMIDSMTEKRYFKSIQNLEYYYYLIIFEWAKELQIFYEYLFRSGEIPRSSVYDKIKITENKLGYLRSNYQWLEKIICYEFDMDISEKAEYIMSKMFRIDIEEVIFMYMSSHVTIHLDIDLEKPSLSLGWWEYLNGHRTELKEFNYIDYKYEN
jgi:transcriptional regulator with XRE-family HTH domain